MRDAVTIGSPMAGLTPGALGSGALAEYGPAPRTLVYLVAAGVLLALACAITLVAAREPRSTAPAEQPATT